MKRVLYLLVLIAITLTSCDKNDVTDLTAESNKQNILTFVNSEDFNSTVNKVNSMSFEERLTWEKTKGFNSYGTICDEKIQEVNPDQFKTIEELKSFVASNSDYVQLFTNPNGDVYFVTMDFKNPERYLMNNDKMYIVGNVVCKQFNDVVVTTDIANIDALKLSNDLKSLNTNPIFKVSSSMSKVPNQKVKNDYEHYFDEFNDVGIYRLHVYFDTFNYTELTEDGWPKYRMTYFKIMNFKKGFLGIWYGTTISTTFDYLIESYDDWSGLTQANYPRTTGSNQSISTYYHRFLPNLKAEEDNGPYIFDYDVLVTNTKGCRITNQNFW